jgi:hypothetical protein
MPALATRLARTAAAVRAGKRDTLPRLTRRARDAAREAADASRGLSRGTVNLAFAVWALALGAVLGLGSADWATRGSYPFGATRIGLWRTWPRAGATDADPYTRAINARQGEIPLAPGEGLRLVAETDADGRALDPACTYRVGGRTPPARAWTLTVVPDPAPRASEGGGPAAAGERRSAFTSTEILREADGRFTVALSPDVQAGNWLPSPLDATGRPASGMRLVLRLYDTPAAANVGTLEPGLVPGIVRTGCAS